MIIEDWAHLQEHRYPLAEFPNYWACGEARNKLLAKVPPKEWKK